MTDSDTPSFDQISNLLRDYGAMQSAAELHGYLSGQLAAGRRLSRSEWLRAANEEADLSRNPDEVAGDSLYELYRTTLAALQNGELSFQPLLPDDDAALAERVDGLGQWCQGFLAGFGMAGSRVQLDAELADALRDLSAIAQVGADEEPESSESDLFSICEYVRLTAVEIFSQCNATPEVPPPPATNALAAGSSPADLFKRKKLH